MSLLDNPAYLADLETAASSREIATKWGRGKSTINSHRKLLGLEKPTQITLSDSEYHRPDGSADYTISSERAFGYEDFREFIRSRGQDPDKVEFSWGVTSNPAGGFWNKLQNVKQKDSAEAVNWVPVQQAALAVYNRTVVGGVQVGGVRTAVILPDPQIGFRMLEGELVPFHDEAAINVATELVKHIEPDMIVHIGDFLDLPTFGKYEQEPSFAHTTQAALDYGHSWLAELSLTTPKQVYLAGNHEARLEKSILNNHAAAFGVRQANLPADYPVLSIPHLLRLGEIGVEYVDGYPAGEFWLNDSVRCIHGVKVNSGGSTAAKNVNDMPHVTTIFGHIHRIEVQSRTTSQRGKILRSYGISPGTLARIDGHVPSVNSGIDSSGRPVGNVENWAQGVLVVHYTETDFTFELVPIHDGVARYQGFMFGV